jgi:hypothetical protein
MAYRYRPGSHPITLPKKKRRPATASPAMPPAPPAPALPSDDELAAYLDTTAAELIPRADTLYDPERLRALIAAERHGKHRKTVIAAFKDRLKGLTT